MNKLIRLVSALALLGLFACGESETRSPKAAQVSDGEYANEKQAGQTSEKHGYAGDKRSNEAGHAEEGLLKLSQEEIKNAGIKIEPLQPKEIRSEITAPATIQANQDKLAHVSPQVAGRIVNVPVSLGDRVKPGQTLAVLDSIEVGEARSAYLQAKSEAALAESEYQRAKRLFDQEVVPQKDYLRALSQREKTAASLRAASGKLRMLGVSNQAGEARSTFALSSTFGGTVLEKHAVLGEMAEPKESLFTIADLSTLWIEADVLESDLGKVATGAEAKVSVSPYPGEVFKGKVTYLSGALDKATRTVKARVEVANAEGRLKPGMFAKVAFATGAGSKALMVPNEAVVLVGGKPVIYIAEDGGFQSREVEIASRGDGQAVIKSGVQAGDSVVVAAHMSSKRGN